LNFAKSNGKSSLISMIQQDNFNTNNAIPKQILSAMDMQGMDTNRAFSAGQPINPLQPIGELARQFEFMIGQNIVQRPRSDENIGFDTMQSVIEMYDVAQMCIEVRQDELRNLEWDIVPIDEDDKNAPTKYSSEITMLRNFFQKPDQYTLFDDFQNTLAYDWLTYDALAINVEKTKGGKVGALYGIDGTTITPMLDWNGRRPTGDAPAYVQFIQGMPWVWLTQDQLIYRTNRKKNNCVYGTPPIEWLLNNINTDIRYQMYFLQYFTDGSIPDTWINAPEDMRQPQQIEQFQKLYDDVMIGDSTQKHKARFIPFGSKVTQAKDSKFDVDFPQFMLNKTCAAYKVAPSELGFTEKVNKSSGDTQENMQYRRSIKPSSKYFESIYTQIISNQFKIPYLKFKFMNIEEQEDQLVMAQRDQVYINTGVLSPDEVRSTRLGLNIDPSNPVPRLFVSGTTVTPVNDIIAQSKANLGAIEAKQPVTNTPVTDNDNNNKPVVDDENHTTANNTAIDNKSVLDHFIKPARSQSLKTK
jgi:hypothetical protein